MLYISYTFTCFLFTNPVCIYGIHASECFQDVTKAIKHAAPGRSDGEDVHLFGANKDHLRPRDAVVLRGRAGSCQAICESAGERATKAFGQDLQVAATGAGRRIGDVQGGAEPSIDDSRSTV